MPASKRRYRLYPRAGADLGEIWLYTLKAWSLDQADSYVHDIIRVFEGLANGTKTGRPVDIRDGYLKYPVGSHMVYYRHSKSHIDIVRILHQRMDVHSKL
ncbi:MAG: type II toxin-antitoxin system RelE/ParE family toxin [Sphingomonadales bacterium]|nr:type II toxin-antitoxin system RelE/ParE family toxin [Sphingomonadales bacterium]